MSTFDTLTSESSRTTWLYDLHGQSVTDHPRPKEASLKNVLHFREGMIKLKHFTFPLAPYRLHLPPAGDRAEQLSRMGRQALRAQRRRDDDRKLGREPQDFSVRWNAATISCAVARRRHCNATHSAQILACGVW